MATGNALGRLFGQSPIAPMQHHMGLAEESVQLLCQLLDACIDEKRDRVDTIYQQLKENAAEVREQRRGIRQHMPRGLFLAMSRSDLLALLELQDRLAQTAQDAARPLALRDMQIPVYLHKPLHKFSSLIASCAAEGLRAVRELDELISDGFGDSERRVVEKILSKLDAQHQRADAQYERVFALLCRHENKLHTLDAVFFHRMADGLNTLTDICGDVGEQLRLLMAK